MKLKLAIVATCHQTGCQVNMVKNNAPIEAVFSSKVKERIKILPKHLVAINTEASPPEIVWRWIRAAVIEIDEVITVVGDMQGNRGKVSKVPDLPLTIQVDDEVWVCGTVQDKEIHDLILDGKPTHPDRLLEYITPIIEAIYQQ